jgi:hypothetical protein
VTGDLPCGVSKSESCVGVTPSVTDDPTTAERRETWGGPQQPWQPSAARRRRQGWLVSNGVVDQDAIPVGGIALAACCRRSTSASLSATCGRFGSSSSARWKAVVASANFPSAKHELPCVNDSNARVAGEVTSGDNVTARVRQRSRYAQAANATAAMRIIQTILAMGVPPLCSHPCSHGVAHRASLPRHLQASPQILDPDPIRVFLAPERMSWVS